MATNYPGSLDTGTEQPSPLSTTEMDDAGFEHDVVHTNHSEAIIALETKVGTGSSTAVADSVLAGTGAGTSAWTTGTLANDISGNAATATSATSATTATNLSGGSVAATTLTASGDANFDSGTLFVDVSANRVGVGTTSPSAELEVRGSSNPEIRIIAGDGTDPALYFGDNTDSVRGGIVYDTSANDLQFRGYNNSTVMTIESDGQVGINTTSPGYQLDVNGNLRSQSYVVVESGTNDKLRLSANTTGNRPYLSINNWNGSSYVRRGYIGYPAAGSSTANINIVADNGDINIAPELTINSGPKLSDPGSSNNLRVTTAYGYLDLGPQNSTYCHIYTDRAQFYTNKGFNSVPFIYWRNNSGVGGPLTDTSSTSGYRYVLQNQTFGTFFDYTSVRDRKDQITNVTAEDSGRWIDALQPVTYIERWMGEGDEPDDARTWREADMQVGFIADDILANADTDHFSQVLDNGEGGLDPAGWKWECVIAAAVAEIKSLRARVAALEAA